MLIVFLQRKRDVCLYSFEKQLEMLIIKNKVKKNQGKKNRKSVKLGLVKSELSKVTAQESAHSAMCNIVLVTVWRLQ